MTRLKRLRTAGILTALVAVFTLGASTNARAQDVTDFTTCFDDIAGQPSKYTAPYWTGICTAIAKLPIGFPELSFGFQFTDVLDANISVDGNGTVTIRANLSAVYFDRPGHNDYAPSATLVLRAKVDSNGKLLGGAGGGACDGSADDLDDFCLQGTVTNPANGIPIGPSVLLRGKFGASKAFGYKKQAIVHGGDPYDDFEFYFENTGGALFNDINVLYGPNFVMEGFANSAYVPANPFAPGTAFTAPYVWGIASPTVAVAADALLNPCSAQIGGTVRNSATAFGIAGVGMTLRDTAANVVSAATTDLAGSYVFMNSDNTSSQFLCAGAYSVEAAPPQGYTPGSANQPVTLVSAQHATVDFGFNVAVTVSTAYTTFGQGAWGAKPKGNNPSQTLGTFFPILANGATITIGTSSCNIAFPTADAVRGFLPQGGAPSALKVCGSTNQKNVLAGQVLTLELNVRFSNAGLTRAGLGNLKVASGPMSGKTVTQVLAEGHKVLGGSTSPFKIGDINDTIDSINKNFEAGTTDKKYLKQ